MPAMPPRRNALYDSYQGFYEQPLARRPDYIPLGEYENDDGSRSLGWAWPQAYFDAVEAAEIPGRYLSGDPNQAVTPEDAQRTAINAAGLMMGGGLVAPRAAGNVAATRVGRAEMPDPIRLYHGTNATASFDKLRSRGGPESVFGDAVYATPHPGLANHYAGTMDGSFDNSRIFPLDVDGPFVTPEEFYDIYAAKGGSVAKAKKEILAQGYNGVFDDGPRGVAVYRPGTVRSATTGETLFSSGSKGGAGVGMGILEGQKPKGITAWHGSPHDFDKFSLGKIGTGEGAQAYGHGLYFADDANVAKTYRGDSDPGAAGYLYEARINANPEDFLDWDLPISQQSPLIRETLERLADHKFSHNRDVASGLTGKQAYGRIDRGQSDAAAPLREVGIPGIRYLDQGSRAAGEGSHNYVVFDDGLVDTVHKWRGDEQLYSSGSPLGSGIGMTTQPDPYEEWFLRNMY